VRFYVARLRLQRLNRYVEHYPLSGAGTAICLFAPFVGGCSLTVGANASAGASQALRVVTAP